MRKVVEKTKDTIIVNLMALKTQMTQNLSFNYITLQSPACVPLVLPIGVVALPP